MRSQFHAGDVCTLSAGVADILRRRLLALCSDELKSRKFQYIQDLATIDVLRDIDCPSCAIYGASFAYMRMRFAYLKPYSTESIYIRRGLRVVSSNVQGNARASTRGTGKGKFHAFIFVPM